MHDGDVLTPASQNAIKGGEKNLSSTNLAKVKIADVRGSRHRPKLKRGRGKFGVLNMDVETHPLRRTVRVTVRSRMVTK